VVRVARLDEPYTSPRDLTSRTRPRFVFTVAGQPIGMQLVLSVGSVHADVTIRADRPPQIPGLTTFDHADLMPGGKAANVAVIARRLGGRSVLWGCVGDDELGTVARRGPQRHGVELQFLRTASLTTGVSVITVMPDGAKGIVLAMGANDAWGDAAPTVAREIGDVLARSTPDAALVVDAECPIEVVDAAMRAARAGGVPVVLDPSPADRVTEAVIAAADHITPDDREAATITGIDTDSAAGAMAAAGQLVARGAGAAYVKLAGGGCAVAAGDHRVLVKPPDIVAVDTTGAGDAFAGALGWALAAGESIAEAARIATAAAMCAVTVFGSQSSYPDVAALRHVLQRVAAVDVQV
jgi:ribokinase